MERQVGEIFEYNGEWYQYSPRIHPCKCKLYLR